jgi:hypothetical protein
MKNNLDEDIDNVKFLIRDLKAMSYNQTFINSTSNVLLELETYKKIAERIARVTCRIANYDSSELEQKVKETIDWARKEVEK